MIKGLEENKTVVSSAGCDGGVNTFFICILWCIKENILKRFVSEITSKRSRFSLPKQSLFYWGKKIRGHSWNALHFATPEVGFWLCKHNVSIVFQLLKAFSINHRFYTCIVFKNGKIQSMFASSRLLLSLFSNFIFGKKYPYGGILLHLFFE